MRVKPCTCGSGKPWFELRDDHGNFLRFVCDACVAQVRARSLPPSTLEEALAAAAAKLTYEHDTRVAA